MPWIGVDKALPPEGEPILLWDSGRNQMRTGAYRSGAFYAEDAAPLDGITHWAWPLEAYSKWEERED